MKLASLVNGRDGRLVVVSRDLTRATDAFPVVPTLQAALDDWAVHAPRLRDLAEGLEHGSVPSFRFHEQHCAAPLPRAFQYLGGSTYANQAGLELPAGAGAVAVPLMYQGGSDSNLGPRQAIRARSEEQGIDFEGEVAVIVDDVPMGTGAAAALGHVRLVMLSNDVSLRNLAPAEAATGHGFIQAKPPTAFSPVAVTPDELGEAWRDGKLHLPLLCLRNGKLVGKPSAGLGMSFGFGALIAHAAATRPLAAGTIIGSGTVSNRGGDGGPAAPLSEGGVGHACILEQRAAETLRQGEARTPYLRFGNIVRMEMKDATSHSIFGAIEQEVLPHAE